MLGKLQEPRCLAMIFQMLYVWKKNPLKLQTEIMSCWLPLLPTRIKNYIHKQVNTLKSEQLNFQFRRKTKKKKKKVAILMKNE